MKRKRVSQSSSASTSSSEEYDVFLNFRGADTRNSFVDCLYEFLTEAGIRVFMDDEALHVGDGIGDELLTAIDSSRLYIPVLSRHYASSKWCMIELARMVKCARKSDCKGILPVFFDVEPEDVKLKTELYTKDLLHHEESFGNRKVRKWRKALRKVSKMKGWNLQSNQGQGKLIRQIAQHISCRLKLKHRIFPDHFIGMEERVQDIMNVLDCGSRDVRIVVIHGMGGIWKMTLASVVFNKICWQFQGCSFLSNVRESSTGNGIVDLQNKLLRDILRFSPHNFCDANDAMNCIQGTLRNKDVLVILDDVSGMDQIRKLIGMGDWVGKGSRAIITTRNLSCVANANEIENNVSILQGKKIYVYQMRELSFDNSLQLLCQHAFNQHAPPHGYELLSRDILSLTRGVPLALEVIGSYLKGKRRAIWNEILNKLKRVPHDRLYQEILMSSYEMLCNEEKEIFLDIAFFFADEDKTSAFFYWKACGLFPEISVDTLISYALIKIGYSNRLWMHDLLKDLGREVVCRQGIDNLGRRSRLCNEDAKLLLVKREGMKYVKALKLDSIHAHNFTPPELSGLSGLRFLELCGGNFVGEFHDGCLSELRWLSMRDSALNFRGTNFYFQNLVVLRLLRSNITDTWAGWEQLKTARNLTELCVSGNQLRRLPTTIGDLDRLKMLDVSSNMYLEGEIPGDFNKLQSLRSLNLSWTGICGVPTWIVQLSRLESLLLSNCDKIQDVPDLPASLTKLEISSGSLKDVQGLSRLTNLVSLELSNRDFDGHRWDNPRMLKENTMAWIRPLQKMEDLTVPPYLSAGLDQLSRLRSLSLSCPSPSVLSLLPSGLEHLSLYHSTSLSRWECLSNLGALSALMIHKSSATEIQLDGLESLKNLNCLDINECEFLERVHDISRLQKLHYLVLLYCPKLVEIGGLAPFQVLLCFGYYLLCVTSAL